MSRQNRRVFMMTLAAGSTALASAGAQAAPKRIEENDPKAVSLGYRHDTAQVDKKRFPKHSPSEKCNNCMAFLGKPADAWAECDLLADKLVANGGWCSSYVKKG